MSVIVMGFDESFDNCTSLVTIPSDMGIVPKFQLFSEILREASPAEAIGLFPNELEKAMIPAERTASPTSVMIIFLVCFFIDQLK